MRFFGRSKPKSALVMWTDVGFTVSIYFAMFIGFSSLWSDESLSALMLAYTYGGCATIFLSQIVWSGCPLRLLESSLRGHDHIPKRSWLFAKIQHTYNKETARAAIVVWCVLSLIVNTSAIYFGYMLCRHC